MKTLIVALGGNALIKPGERGTPDQMINNLRAPIKQIAKLSEYYNKLLNQFIFLVIGILFVRTTGISLIFKD